MAIGWRTTFGKGKCVVEDVNTRTVKYSGVLDRGIMLYVVPVSQVLGSRLDTATLDSLETLEQALNVMIKHGAEYAMLTVGRRVIVVDSGASKCLFRRKGMFKRYIE